MVEEKLDRILENQEKIINLLEGQLDDVSGVIGYASQAIDDGTAFSIVRKMAPDAATESFSGIIGKKFQQPVSDILAISQAIEGLHQIAGMSQRGMHVETYEKIDFESAPVEKNQRLTELMAFNHVVYIQHNNNNRLARRARQNLTDYIQRIEEEQNADSNRPGLRDQHTK